MKKEMKSLKNVKLCLEFEPYMKPHPFGGFGFVQNQVSPLNIIKFG